MHAAPAARPPGAPPPATPLLQAARPCRCPAPPHLDGGDVLGRVVQAGAHEVKVEAGLRQAQRLLLQAVGGLLLQQVAARRQGHLEDLQQRGVTEVDRNFAVLRAMDSGVR
jgi:hypothetical protein